MKNVNRFKSVGIGIMLIICAVFGAAVMLLWNALMPHIFGLPPIEYPQAVGLLLLARLLFGGLHGHAGHHRNWRSFNENDSFMRRKNKLREKWMSMSEDERNDFLKNEKDFFKFRRRFLRFGDFFDDEENQEHKGKGNE